MKKLLVFLALFVSLGLYSQHVTAQDRLDLTLTRLAKCESGSNENALNPNDVGSPSYGLYQYKKGTFLTYTRKYGLLPHAEDQEVFNFLFDGDYQTQLTRRILQDGGSSHWKNCWRMIHEVALR